MPIYEYNCLDCSKTFEKIVWNTGIRRFFALLPG